MAKGEVIVLVKQELLQMFHVVFRNNAITDTMFDKKKIIKLLTGRGGGGS